MQNPIHALFNYLVRCHNCGILAKVHEEDGGEFWLADTWWRCGNCDELMHRSEMKDEQP